MIYNNRYRVDAKIGEGGMAFVYRGYDLLLHRQVAIKVLRPQFAADEDFVQRFYQEAQAAARLSHPKIVNTYDVGENDGINYIVQEYVGGETLAALIEREGKLPEAAAIRYTQQICRALSASHRADLLHRDIKPSNILVTPDDDVRVADFGIAGAAETQGTASDAIMGSVPYCAPEVLAGDALSEATDLYSVGVVMYEMVTGKRPYPGESAQEVAAGQASGADAEALAVSVSPALGAIILKLIDPAPKNRYQTAGELLGALRRVARGESNADEDEPGLDSPTAVIRRRSAARRASVAADDAAPATWSGRRLAIFAAAAFAIVLIVAGVFTAMQSSARGLRMPDVGGKAVSDAVDLLHQSGIDDVSIKQHPDPKTQAGLIDGTEPPAGSAMRPTDRVTLMVSAGPQSTAVPNVVGKNLKTATATLAAAGFSVQVGTTIHSYSVPVGAVAKTNPGAGSPAEKSGTVVLFPSSGPQAVSVPNVVSLTDGDARAALTKLGLTMQVAQVVASDNIPAHTIIDQDPTGGTPAEPHSAVMVTVSGGPNAVAVPSVVGGTVDDARRVLSQAGLAVGNIAQAMDSGTTPGTVVSQNPQANAQTAQGGTVDLVIAANSVASPLPEPATSASPADQGKSPMVIPNVLGMTVDAARAVLEKAGFTVAKVILAPGSPPDAKVVATDPPMGGVPPSGVTVVNLVLGPQPGH
ncbi:MAG TPA: Stk1 family PASTA domain-containing Ser/Thr kinase [Candidatus Eremiobacteraceae bacterium]